jgi:hypothetical protein
MLYNCLCAYYCLCAFTVCEQQTARAHKMSTNLLRTFADRINRMRIVLILCKGHDCSSATKSHACNLSYKGSTVLNVLKPNKASIILCEPLLASTTGENVAACKARLTDTRTANAHSANSWQQPTAGTEFMLF